MSNIQVPEEMTIEEALNFQKMHNLDLEVFITEVAIKIKFKVSRANSM